MEPPARGSSVIRACAPVSPSSPKATAGSGSPARPTSRFNPKSKIQNPKSKIGKVTTADVLEALARASGLPIVADYYPRLYPLRAASVQNRPLLEALNQLAAALRLRWNKEG